MLGEETIGGLGIGTKGNLKRLMNKTLADILLVINCKIKIKMAIDIDMPIDC